MDSVTYGELDVDPVDVPRLLDLPSLADADEIYTALQNMIITAQNNGLPLEFVPNIRQLLQDFRDIWSISLQAGSPAKLQTFGLLSQHRSHLMIWIYRWSNSDTSHSHFSRGLSLAPFAGGLS
jgi:hypothetical protein